MKFIVTSGHQEYNPDPDIEGLTITDFTLDDEDGDGSVFDLSEEDARQKIADDNGIPVDEIPELRWSTEGVVRWEGERDAIEKGLASLIGQIDAEPGGDDDTFDYWPSGVLYAKQVAEKLGDEWPDRVKKVALRILQWKEDWAAELADKIGYDVDEIDVIPYDQDSPHREEWEEINRLSKLLKKLENGLPVETGDVANAADIARLALQGWTGLLEGIDG